MPHSTLISRPGRLFAIFLCSVIVAFKCISGMAAPSRSEVIAEAKLAIQKGDTRFVTVLGYSVDVPGIPDGAVNGLVLAHGKKPPIGVGDFIRNESEHQEQQDADAYAQTYNLYLLKFLLAHPDQKTKSYLQKVRQELQRFGKANPKSDAMLSFKATPTFLLVAGQRGNGYSIDDSRTSHVETRLLLMNEAVLQGAELKIFNKVVKTYVTPYNRNLYKLLKQKWAKQGIKSGRDMP